ncbi:MAG TPA: hypothetical protein PLF13_09220 [candidate division Zixibacteria bacterium]|nr:hypothetical protein [candidate division Zixibacteria bacterium]
MHCRRVIYRNWIVDLGRNPAAGPMIEPYPSPDAIAPPELIAEVDKALSRLTEEEREFVVRFYYMGESHGHLAGLTGRKVHKLESMHKRIMRKLRRLLSPFVCERYGIGVEPGSTCVICRSPARDEIDTLIANRDRSRTWRPVIRKLRQRFGIRITSPQTLISHEQYHMILPNNHQGDISDD